MSKLHYIKVSPPCQYVLLPIWDNNWDIETVNIKMGVDNKSPEYLSKHPIGQVPMYEEGDFGVGESQAILRYLLATRETSDTYWPKDHKAQAKLDMVMSWATSSLNKAFSALYYACQIAPVWRGAAQPSAEEKAKLDKDFSDQLANLTKFIHHFGGDYVTGSNYTVADSTVFTNIHNIVETGHFSLEAFPEVHAWYERVKTHAGPAKIIEACNKVW